MSNHINELNLTTLGKQWNISSNQQFHPGIAFTEQSVVFPITLTHLNLFTSGEHEFSDKLNCCRFSTHMDLLSTQTYSEREMHH